MPSHKLLEILGFRDNAASKLSADVIYVDGRELESSDVTIYITLDRSNEKVTARDVNLIICSVFFSSSFKPDRQMVLTSVVARRE